MPQLQVHQKHPVLAFSTWTSNIDFPEFVKPVVKPVELNEIRWILCVHLPFIAFHCLSLPFIAFHCLSLPFIAFHCLSLHPSESFSKHCCKHTGTRYMQYILSIYIYICRTCHRVFHHTPDLGRSCKASRWEAEHSRAAAERHSEFASEPILPILNLNQLAKKTCADDGYVCENRGEGLRYRILPASGDMTGGEENSHLRRSVFILVYIFRGTQRGVSRGSWILLVERRTLDYTKRLVRDGYDACLSSQEMQIEKDVLWACNEFKVVANNGGVRLVSSESCIFYPNIFRGCKASSWCPWSNGWPDSNPCILVCKSSDLKKFAPVARNFLEETNYVKTFQILPHWLPHWLQQIASFFVTLRGLTWSSAWCGSTHRGGRNVWTHSCRTTTDHSLVR